MAANKKKKPGLELQMILDAAWEVVDEGGVSALTIRSIAAKLDVQGPALYWHVKSMQVLQSLMVESLMVGCVHPREDGEHWADWFREVTINQRRALLKYRHSGLLSAIAEPTNVLRKSLHDRVIKTLVESGLKKSVAASVVGLVASYSLGWVIYEQKESAKDMLALHRNVDRAFEQGLDVIFAGFVAPEESH